jgi:D-sedoheptulose 7-phosphate isomerase
MSEKSDLIKNRIKDSISYKEKFIEQAGNIEKVADAIINAYNSGKKVLLCGNGGSAADCQHIAGELVGRYLLERKALPAISLSTDTSILTALSNDYDFSLVFSRQVEALANKGDILIGISTSGNSENIIKAFIKGKEIGTINISFTGRDGGKLSGLSDININSIANETPRVQECHQIAYHIICELVELGIVKNK